MEGTFPVGLIECCLLPIRFRCLIFERLEMIVPDIIFLNVSNSIFFINIGIRRSLLILINISNNPVDNVSRRNSIIE